MNKQKTIAEEIDRIIQRNINNDRFLHEILTQAIVFERVLGTPLKD